MDDLFRGFRCASSAISYAGGKFEHEDQDWSSPQVYGMQEQAYQKRTGLSAPRSLGLRKTGDKPWGAFSQPEGVKSGEEL